MDIIVDQAHRHATMRAHTATHLLHAALCQILPYTKQEGSLVDEDYVRFDFTADHLLSDLQLADIESNINQQIYENYQVSISSTNKEVALQSWAKAFFQDKYGDTVRVVQITQEAQNIPISIELCWWTHVSHTSHIGIFKIIAQQAVASGIKRIVAYTWPKVYTYISQYQKEINWLWVLLDCKPKQIIEKTTKVIKEHQHNEKLLQSIIDRYIWLIIIQYRQNYVIIKDISCMVIKYEDIGIWVSLSLIWSAANKTIRWSELVICYDIHGSYVIVGDHQKIQIITNHFNLKGWWNNNMIQGKDNWLWIQLEKK
jgi:alanyl-tRNA synthetase